MTSQFDELKTVLADRYAVDRELGSGGMATVYLAEDLKHDRQVAIKVLRPEFAATLGLDRFLLEIKIAARLRHPHILPLYDSGDAYGLLYYVMPYVAGESLRQRLNREKQLPMGEALAIAGEVADALSYAHGQNVVHRDIKPENILLEAGHAGVADFGIARAVSVARADRLTKAGTPVGTPSYMSPEQASGSDDLDGRSDIYSLGCVLYEMLAGQPPFTGPTIESIAQQHLTAPRPRVTTMRSTVPGEIEMLLLKALSRTPADRFTDATRFTNALAECAAELPQRTTGVRAAAPVEKSIAVLPFTNMSPDPENEYFSDGITEEIINALTQHKEFRVAARSSCFAFKGRSPDVGEVASKLNVATVLEGSVRKAGNRVRITAQLINAADGYHLWSNRYDREMADVFAIQDEIATSMVETLLGELGGDHELPKVRRYTDNVVAYELYLKGRYVEKTRTREGIAKGIEYFQQAINETQDFAPAYAGLADSHYLQAWYRYLRPTDAFPQAHEAATRALAIDETLAEAHTALGAVKFYYEWDWSGAEASFARAVELNPNYAVAWHWYGELLAATQRLDEALEMVGRAHDLDPLSLTVNAGVGWVRYFRREFDQATERFRKTLELDPDYVFLNWFLGQAYLENGKLNDAIAAFRRGRDRSGGHPGMAAYLGHACARAGQHEEALEILDGLRERAQHRYVPCDYLAVVCMGLGRDEEALHFLEHGLGERALHYPFLAVDPLFDSLRTNPRFTQLLRNIGHEPT